MDRDISSLYVFFWVFCGLLMLAALLWIGALLLRISERLDRIAKALEREAKEPEKK